MRLKKNSLKCKTKTYKKMKRSTFNLTFACRKSKATKAGVSPVELVINLNGKRTYFTLARKEKSEDFAVNINSKKNNDTKTFCDAMRMKFQGYITELLERGVPVTTDSIRKFINNGYSDSYTFQDLVKDYDVLLRQRIDVDFSYENYCQYEFTYGQFSEFVGDKQLSAITVADFQSFITYLEKKYNGNTVSNKFTKIKTIFLYAFNQGKIKSNPAYSLKVKRVTKQIDTLTQEEFSTLLYKRFDDNPCYERLRKLFVFACGSGISFSDCLLLKPEDFQEIDGRTYVIKERKKTGIPFYSILLPEAVEIAKEYNYDLSPLKITNQNANIYLKAIGTICGIKCKMTFHRSRHYYARLLINHNVSLDVVSKCLGHSNTRITKHYAKQLSSVTLRSVINEFEAVGL